MFMRGPHDPIRIERAEGPWLYASDGHKILDAGAGAVVVGTAITNLDWLVREFAGSADTRPKPH